MGIAFQIKDDLFDYGNEVVGKPTGNDIREKKLTLPLIYTLNHCNPALKKDLIYIIKNENRRKEKVNEVIDVVIEKWWHCIQPAKNGRIPRQKALQITV